MSKYASPIMPKFFKDTSMPRRAVGMMMQKADKNNKRRGKIGTARPNSKGYVDPGQFGYDFRGLSRLSDTDLAALATDPQLREDFFARNPNIVGALRRTAGNANSQSRRVREGAPATGISERRYNAINSLLETMRLKPVSRPKPRIPAKRSTTSWNFVDPVESRVRVIQPDNFDAREQLNQRRLQREQRKLTGTAYVPTETYQRQIKDIDRQIGQLKTQAQGASVQTAQDIDKDIDALKFERQRLQGKVRNREQMFVREKLPTISSIQSRVRSLDKQIVELQDELRVSSGNVADDVQRDIRALEGRRAATQQELDEAKKSPWYVKNQGKEVLRVRPETGVSIKSPEQQGFGGRAYVVSRRDRLRLFNEVMNESRSPSRPTAPVNSPAVSATAPDMNQERFAPSATPATPPSGAKVVGDTKRPRGRPRKDSLREKYGSNPIEESLFDAGLLGETRRGQVLAPRMRQGKNMSGIADSSRAPSPKAMMSMIGEIPTDMDYASRMVRNKSAGKIITVDDKMYEVVGDKFIPEYSPTANRRNLLPEDLMRIETVTMPRSTTKPVFGVGSAEKPVMATIQTPSVTPKYKGSTPMPKDDELLMRLLGIDGASGRAPSRRASVSVTVPASPVSYEDAPFIRAGRSATTPVAPTTRRARLRVVSDAGSRARVSTAAPVTVDTRPPASAPSTVPTSKPSTARIFAPSFGGKPATVIDVMDDADDFVPPRPSKGAYTTWSDVKDTFNRGVKAPLSTWNHPKNKGLSNKLNTLGAAREGWQKTMEVAGDTIPGRVTRQAVRPAKWVGSKIKNAPRSVKIGLGLLALGGAAKWADNNVFNQLPRAKENPTTNASDIFNVNKRMSKRMTKSAYANTMMKQSTRIKKSTPTPPASRNVNRKSTQRLTFDGIKVSNKYF